MDIAGRSAVYHALLELLKFLSSDPALAELLLLADEKSNRIPELLDALYTQAGVFLTCGGEVAEAAGEEEGAMEAVSMAMALRDAVEQVRENLALLKLQR